MNHNISSSHNNNDPLDVRSSGLTTGEEQQLEVTNHINLTNEESFFPDDNVLSNRSTMQAQEMSADEFKKIIFKKSFSNDIFYVIKDDLSFHADDWLTVLPKNLSVRGNIKLKYCNALTTLPKNLSVGNDLNIYYCDVLTTLPENLNVGGDLYLETCYSLTTSQKI